MSPKGEKIVGYLVRHGDTDMTDRKVFLSRADYPLNDKGRKQIEETLDFLRENVEDCCIYSSPLIRCLEMAHLFADGREVVQDRGLLPWDRGIFTGIPSEEGEDSLELYVKNPDVKIPFGESRIDAEKRITDFFVPALKEAEERTAVFFTHHSVIDILAYLVEGKRPDKMVDVVEVAGIAAIYLDGDSFRVEGILHASPKGELVS